MVWNTCCGILVVEYLLWNYFVVEYLLWNTCCGILVVEYLLWNTCCGITLLMEI